MRPLNEQVRVARRFTRAVRVDDDFGDGGALEGYVCSQSIVEVLLTMGRHKDTTGHGAFTWTGPYGSGKSSLAVALATLAAGDEKIATSLLAGIDVQERAELIDSLRPSPIPWRIAPVVGYRGDPSRAIEVALDQAAGVGPKLKRMTDETLAHWATRLAADRKSAGLILFIDEMGKFLEHAARNDGDVHVFQELAEAASRAGGRLLVIGILHQAFDEYANRLAREARDEWLKIQGRYLDIAINLAAEEQLDLIGRAIEGPKPPPGNDVRVIAAALKTSRLGSLETVESRLAACWPLHPIVAALLGPITRRRFGQNQRSLFGFLSSAEPFGFQAHLAETPSDAAGGVYPVERLWDYLHANLESAILASPDGHRWATALEAVQRAEARDASADHLALLKTIALIDLFKDRSGLTATAEVLATVLPEGRDVEKPLADLKCWSVAIFRGHANAYAVYAGSDFDIDTAVDEVRRAGVAVDYKRLAHQASLQPILAKRHYEDTGALRWFEVELVPLSEAEERIAHYKPAAGAAGLFLLAISAESEEREEAKTILKRALKRADDRLVVCGWARDSYMIREMASDLAALEQVRTSRPELEGDAVARREIDARLARLSIDLEDRLGEAINSVDWHLPAEAKSKIDVGVRGPAGLSVLASRLADWRYPLAPCLPNELVNRTRPSSTAQGAVRALLHAMTERGDQPRLGFEGYPPEAGLHISLLEWTGLHRWDEDLQRWRFLPPTVGDKFRLAPLWAAADRLLQDSPKGVRASDLHTLWRAPPFGVRNGLMPILTLAYLLTRAGRSAVYLDGVFRPSLDTFFVDRLLQDAASVSLRAVDLTEVDVAYVAALADGLGHSENRVAPTTLEVARSLVREVRALPNWTLRTTQLDDAAKNVRDRAKASDDPNTLLLDDIPAALGFKPGEFSGPIVARKVLQALQALRNAYPDMLAELAAVLRRELRIRGEDDLAITALHRRAQNVRGLSGNFRLDALATRLSSFTGNLDEIEGLASLAANKPPRDWVDRDVDAARIELAALAQQFLKAELYARVKNRVDERVSLAVYISDPGYPEPRTHEIELSSSDKIKADRLAGRMMELLTAEGADRHLAIAALASLGLTLQQPGDEERERVA